MIDTITAAIERVRALRDDSDQAEINEANMAVAVALGYHLIAPSNFPYWSISRDPDANPYDSRREALIALPDYVGDLGVAYDMVPAECDISWRRKAGVLYATCLRPDGSEIGGFHSAVPARAVIVAALLARAECASASRP